MTSPPSLSSLFSRFSARRPRSGPTVGLRVPGLALLSGSLVAAQFALALASLRLFDVAYESGSIWLPSGLAYAAALWAGWASVPGLFMGQFLFDLFLGSGALGTATLLAAGDGFAAAGLILALRAFKGTKPPDPPRPVVTEAASTPMPSFTSVACFALASTVNAAFGFIAFHPAEAPSLTDVLTFTSGWVMADVLAAVSMGTLLLAILSRSDTRPRPHGLAEYLITLGALMVFMAFGSSLVARVPALVLSALALPIMVWAALRFGLVQSLFFNFLAALFLVSEFVRSLYPTFVDDRDVAFGLAQFHTAALLLTAMVVATYREKQARSLDVIRQINEANVRAEAENRAKSHFLATLSHEIRTPLNGVVGLAELAAEDSLSPEARQRYLAHLKESAALLNATIGDVLDMSKIEAGQMPIEPVAFELRPMLERLTGTFLGVAQGKDLKITLQVDPGVPRWVKGDPIRIQQVLGNFLSNAVKFTERGAIGLSCRMVASGLLFEVTDTGIGMSAAQIERLFRPFTQVDESATRRIGGTGLGLTIAKQLANLMGGEVGVESTPSRGSRFWVRLSLPLAADPAPAALATDKPRADSDATRTLVGLRVLVAEDNKTNAFLARQMLEREGALVTCVSDGAQAVEALFTGDATPAAGAAAFDLVLMDVHMPEMDGIEATRRIRAREATGLGPGQRVPILAMTAGVLLDERDAVMGAGMDDFIAKPMSRETLIGAVRRHAG